MTEEPPAVEPERLPTDIPLATSNTPNVIRTCSGRCGACMQVAPYRACDDIGVEEVPT